MSEVPSDMLAIVIGIVTRLMYDIQFWMAQEMLTDSLVGVVNMLPYLDVGECVGVGDAIMLPSEIVLDKPEERSKSATIGFWNRWFDGEKTIFDIDAAALNMIKQLRG